MEKKKLFSGEGQTMKAEQTLPKLLAERASTERNKIALRQKSLGIWEEVTWGKYYENVEQIAIGLSEKCNFQFGEKLAIIGENRPQWLYSQMAAQVLGGISVGIYQESMANQIIYYLNDCKARVVIVEDQEQVDKLLSVEDKIPFVEHVIFYDEKGMRHYKHPKLCSFNNLLGFGKLQSEKDNNFYSKLTERLLGSDTAIIAYSAATTGDPKGSMLAHSNLIAAARNLNDLDEMDREDDYLSFLPLSWIHEQVLSIALPLLNGIVINFPEKPHTVLLDLGEIEPQTLLAPPRVFETLLSNFTTRIEAASWFKRKVYELFKKHGDAAAKAKVDKQELSPREKMMNKLGDWIIFGPIRKHLGLTRLKRAYVAGGALETGAFYFFHSIGVNVRQSYGGTELAGIAFVQPDDDIRVGSSGVALPNTEVKIGEDGNIFVRNSATFSKYLNEEDRETIVDNWITIGDYGYLNDDGHLYILDRLEDIVVSSDGQNVYPRLIENNLKSSPYIQEAVCFGKDKPYMIAMLNIDMNSVGRWADKNRINYTAYSDLSRHPEVIEFIEEEAIKSMKDLPNHARVKKFIILHKQLNADDGELTRTLKIRRKYVQEKYQAIIDDMYSDSLEVEVLEGLEYDEAKKGVTVRLKVIQPIFKQGVA